MNPITELKQLYNLATEADLKLRRKIAVLDLQKYFPIYYNAVLQEKLLYTYYAFSLLESKSGTAASEQVKTQIYGDNHITSSIVLKPYEGFFFPIDTYTFLTFQFTYQNLPYVHFNRLFRLLLFICCGCYRVNTDYYCSIAQMKSALGYDTKTIISLLDELQSGGWILQTSVGNNYKGKPNSYKINLDLVNFSFYCNSHRKDGNLTNFCFRKENV